MRGLFRDLFYEPQFSHENEKRQTLPLARYLAYLLIVTMTVTGVSLSRYSTSSSANDPARAAKFDVLITHTGTPWSDGEYNDKAYNVSGGGKSYTFTATNNGEVAVGVFLVIDSYDFPVTVTPSVTTDDWINNGVLLSTAGSGSSNSVTITVPGNAGNDPSLIGGNEVKVHFEYEQVD